MAGAVDDALQIGDLAWRQRRDAGGDGLRLREERRLGNDLRGDAHGERLGGVEALAEEDELARLPEPDEARQQRGDAARHEETEADLREEAARRLGEDRDVAVDDPFEAAADRPAMDRADHHLLAAGDGARHVLDELDIGTRLLGRAALLLELLE